MTAARKAAAEKWLALAIERRLFAIPGGTEVTPAMLRQIKREVADELSQSQEWLDLLIQPDGCVRAQVLGLAAPRPDGSTEPLLLNMAIGPRDGLGVPGVHVERDHSDPDRIYFSLDPGDEGSDP